MKKKQKKTKTKKKMSKKKSLTDCFLKKLVKDISYLYVVINGYKPVRALVEICDFNWDTVDNLLSAGEICSDTDLTGIHSIVAATC